MRRQTKGVARHCKHIDRHRPPGLLPALKREVLLRPNSPRFRRGCDSGHLDGYLDRAVAGVVS